MPAGDPWHGFGVTAFLHGLCRGPGESVPTGTVPAGPANPPPQVQGSFELSHPPTASFKHGLS